MAGEKWTKGPWTHGQCPAGTIIETGWDHPQLKGPYPVVTIGHGVDPRGKPYTKLRIGEADAHLIAAAPDLYAALKKAAETLENAIRAGLEDFSKEDEDEIVRNHVTMKIVRAALAKARGES